MVDVRESWLVYEYALSSICTHNELQGGGTELYDKVYLVFTLKERQ